MPIFGLVWVASWVNCFFSSHQTLLRIPSYLAVLPAQTAAQMSEVHSALLPTAHDRAGVTLSVSSQNRFFGQSTQIQLVPAASLLPLHVDTPLPSLGLLSAFRGLLSGFQKLTAVNHAPPVVVTQVDAKQLTDAHSDHPSTAGLGFGQCLPIAQNSELVASSLAGKRSQKHSLFQVNVKGHVVSAVPQQQQAMQIAHRLEQVLGAVEPQFQQLQPGIVNGVPVGKLGDRVLFTVDQQVAAQWHCTADMLAIQWVNALRTAVAQEPLALADAQTKMYELQTTGQYIEGVASWYGPYFHGRQTATGETFNQDDFTAAHPSLPFGTFLKVTNLANGKVVVVRVNDRGPYFENRMLDLSREAARCLGSETVGVVSIEAEIMQSASTVLPGQAIAQRL